MKGGGGDVLNDGPAQGKQGLWSWGCVSWDPHSVWIPLCGVAASDSHMQRGGLTTQADHSPALLLAAALRCPGMDLYKALALACPARCLLPGPC